MSGFSLRSTCRKGNFGWARGLCLASFAWSSAAVLWGQGVQPQDPESSVASAAGADVKNPHVDADGNIGVLNASSFKGEDLSVQVNACLTAVAAAGGGTCDARGYPATNYASQSITVGDGLHNVTLLLPAGTILFGNDRQLVYRSHSNILGQGIGHYKSHGLPPGSGSILYCSPATTKCVVPYPEPDHLVQYAHLANFSIQSAPTKGIPAADSIGLSIGGGVGGVDVASSRFEYLGIGGFDVGTQMGGAYGCTCYNDFEQVYSTGRSYGVSTINVSKYFGDVNSNSWNSGTAWGAVGLSDVGGSKNRWIGIDIEGAKTHGMVIRGYGSSVISPYEEANGCDLIEGTANMVIGPLAYGGGAWQPCPASKSASDFWLGPDAAPKTIGALSGLVFGSPKMYDDGYNSQFTLLTGSALNLNYSGNQITVYGHDGHGPLNVGGLGVTSGVDAKGRSIFQSLPDPAAPTLAAIGGTGTIYTYSVIGYDMHGGVTLPSKAATVSGPPVLGTVFKVSAKTAGSGYAAGDIVTLTGGNSRGDARARITSVAPRGAVTGMTVVAGGTGYASLNSGSVVIFSTSGGHGADLTVTIEATHISITPQIVDGIHCVDVLKGDLHSLLPATIGDVYGCGVHNALPRRLDFGQATLPFLPPGRNNTGDLAVSGLVAAERYCLGGSNVCWSTTKAAPEGECINGSMDTNTTNGNLYVCQSKAWVEK